MQWLASNRLGMEKGVTDTLSPSVGGVDLDHCCARMDVKFPILPTVLRGRKLSTSSGPAARASSTLWPRYSGLSPYSRVSPMRSPYASKFLGTLQRMRSLMTRCTSQISWHRRNTCACDVAQSLDSEVAPSTLFEPHE